jgi:hypothetical protein
MAFLHASTSQSSVISLDYRITAQPPFNIDPGIDNTQGFALVFVDPVRLAQDYPNEMLHVIDDLQDLWEGPQAIISEISLPVQSGSTPFHVGRAKSLPFTIPDPDDTGLSRAQGGRCPWINDPPISHGVAPLPALISRISRERMALP